MSELPAVVASHGPYAAVVCRFKPHGFEPFDQELLGPLLPHLRIVVSAMKGIDDFDIAWMTRRGIWFCNSREATRDATADMTLFLILAVLRDTCRAERNFRQGHWRSGLQLSRGLSDITLGIVAMGNIGTTVAWKCAALGMKICYYARGGAEKQDAPWGARSCRTLNELLRCSDVVSLHCPLTDATRHMIGRDELETMSGSYLINTSRGAVVDNQALIEALESGKLVRAGLDVFEGEPGGIDPYFMESDKVIVQPHMGGLTEGSFECAEEECLSNIASLLRSGRPRVPLNDVQVQVPIGSVQTDVQTAAAAAYDDVEVRARGRHSVL